MPRDAASAFCLLVDTGYEKRVIAPIFCGAGAVIRCESDILAGECIDKAAGRDVVDAHAEMCGISLDHVI